MPAVAVMGTAIARSGTRARARTTTTVSRSRSPSIPIPAPTSSRSARRGSRPSVTCQLNPQGSTIMHGSIHSVHCVLSISALVEPYEGKASALFGPIIARDVNIADISILVKDLP